MKRKLMLASAFIVLSGFAACGNKNSGTQTDEQAGYSGTGRPAAGMSVMESTTTPSMQGNGTTNPAAPR